MKLKLQSIFQRGYEYFDPITHKEYDATFFKSTPYFQVHYSSTLVPQSVPFPIPPMSLESSPHSSNSPTQRFLDPSMVYTWRQNHANELLVDHSHEVRHI